MTTSPTPTSTPPADVHDDRRDRESRLSVVSVDADDTVRRVSAVIPLGAAEDAEDPDVFAGELLAAAFGIAAQRGSAFAWAFSRAVADASSGALR